MRRLRAPTPGLLTLALCLSACIDTGEPSGSTGGSVGDAASSMSGTGGETDEGTGGSESDTGNGSAATDFVVPTGVEVLFVVDNSWSMGEEQGALAQALHNLTERLEASRTEIDYRIALTATDNGHNSCTSKPGSGGLLRLSSCLDREEAFVDPGQQISRYNTACAAHCEYSEAELTRRPTTTDQDADEKVRPWVERVSGRANLPDNIEVGAALACFAPLGIDGCGYEAPLETMYRAVGLSLEKHNPSYDFVREQDLLHIVHVTDEADCSYNHKASGTSAVFDDANTTFWSNPEVGPTSSICWNAGVTCSGEINGFYESCEVTNKDVAGNHLEDPDSQDSVLFPLSRYRKFFDAIAEQKAVLGIIDGVAISLVAGVDANGWPAYPIGLGTDHFDQFGIGPGCVGKVDVLDERDPTTGEIVPAQAGVDSYAVPPVRLAAFSKAYREQGADGDFSVCEANMNVALDSIAKQIARRFEPQCVQACVADANPQSPWVDAQCRVTGMYRGASVDIPECRTKTVDVDSQVARTYVVDDRGRLDMPDDVDTCFTVHGDPGEHTPSTLDDLAETCADAGYNLSAMIHHRYGTRGKAGTRYTIACGISSSPEIDCAELQ